LETARPRHPGALLVRIAGVGLGGRAAKALELLTEEPFFIINGDTLTNVDLDALAAYHRASGALVTIAVVPNEHPTVTAA
jgi:mannose-1-phosphate guanylyltransferase/phosphomannomutase